MKQQAPLPAEPAYVDADVALGDVRSAQVELTMTCKEAYQSSFLTSLGCVLECIAAFVDIFPLFLNEEENGFNPMCGEVFPAW